MKKLAKKALAGDRLAREQIYDYFGDDSYLFLKFLAEYMKKEKSEKNKELIFEDYAAFAHNVLCSIEYANPSQEQAQEKYNRMMSILLDSGLAKRHGVRMFNTKDLLIFDEKKVDNAYKKMMNLITDTLREYEGNQAANIVAFLYGFDIAHQNICEMVSPEEIAESLHMSIENFKEYVAEIMDTLKEQIDHEELIIFLFCANDLSYVLDIFSNNPDLRCEEALEQVSFLDSMTISYFTHIIKDSKALIDGQRKNFHMRNLCDCVKSTCGLHCKCNCSIKTLFDKIGQSNFFDYCSTKVCRNVFSKLFETDIFAIRPANKMAQIPLEVFHFKSKSLNQMFEKEGIGYYSEIIELQDIFLNPTNHRSMEGYMELLSVLKDDGVISLKI